MQFGCHIIEYHIKNPIKDPDIVNHPIHCYGLGFVICITTVQRSQPEAKPHPLQAVQISSETPRNKELVIYMVRHQ